MQTGFGGKLLLEYVGGTIFKLHQAHEDPFHYVSRAGIMLTPHHHTATNGASIPRILWSLFPRTGTKGIDYFRSAVLHDWLYTAKIVTRDLADEIFYEAMITEGVPKIVAWGFYMAVRLFGGTAWRRA